MIELSEETVAEIRAEVQELRTLVEQVKSVLDAYIYHELDIETYIAQ